MDDDEVDEDEEVIYKIDIPANRYKTLDASLALVFSYDLSVNINIPFDELNLDFNINLTWHCSYLLLGMLYTLRVKIHC